MRTHFLGLLFSRPPTIAAPSPAADALDEVGRALQARGRRLFGRSLTIREIDAGSCNGCELEIHALNNAVYDIERFGIRFVASPRHADVLLVTGPVTHNMKVALERTYAATPAPKWVVAAGDCAAGCGVFQPSYAIVGSVDKIIPVDLHIKGCPPRPIQLLQVLLALLDQASGRPPRKGGRVAGALLGEVSASAGEKDRIAEARPKALPPPPARLADRGL
jgi:Ni,Fe-hydrogenase III small subunit